ncbi:MAG: class I tRNA ligase family protein, partial [Candidatus Coatesbacteria bacterium]|nr:class I tRNA ligase family protein [Candidatus Coatesbacteria bacterium]
MQEEQVFRKASSNYDQHEIEPRILKLWEERRFFQRLVEQNKDGPRFSFIDGPITANNKMGVHHAWGRTYKDIFVRYKAMQGFHQRYQNGFDCQGLWVEVEVEKDLGLNSKRDIREYGLDRFSKKCQERVLEYARAITEQSKRLGQWMDWDNSYYTMTDT